MLHFFLQNFVSNSVEHFGWKFMMITTRRNISMNRCNRIKEYLFHFVQNILSVAHRADGEVENLLLIFMHINRTSVIGVTVTWNKDFNSHLHSIISALRLNKYEVRKIDQYRLKLTVVDKDSLNGSVTLNII